MKKAIFLIVLSLAACRFASAQLTLSELSRDVREIKPLESNREDVRKILADYDLLTPDDSRHYDSFSAKDVSITVSYSSGKCSENASWWDSPDYWDAPEWTVIEIAVSPKKTTKAADSGVDFSKYRRERMFENLPRYYIYHNKNLGSALDVTNGDLVRFYILPSKINYSSLCNNEPAKKYRSSKKWFFDSKLKDRSGDIFFPPQINDLILSATEIVINCRSSDSKRDGSCPDGAQGIEVVTDVRDPDNDVLSYDYKISDGQIIGRGKNVIWDLSGVKAGIYTITATADDGSGNLTTATKTIVVKENPDCLAK